MAWRGVAKQGKDNMSTTTGPRPQPPRLPAGAGCLWLLYMILFTLYYRVMKPR